MLNRQYVGFFAVHLLKNHIPDAATAANVRKVRTSDLRMLRIEGPVLG